MNKNVFDMFVGVIGLSLMFAVPTGIILANYYENNAWLLMSIISFILLCIP